MRAHLEPHYLISDSLAQLKACLLLHPVLMGVALIALYAAVLGLLRWRFGRIRFDILLFSWIITGLLIVAGSAVHTLIYVKGFTFGG